MRNRLKRTWAKTPAVVALLAITFSGLVAAPEAAEAAGTSSCTTTNTYANSNGYCTITFTTTGADTWTVPANVDKIDVLSVGGGGGGNRGICSYLWGAGGGGGGYAEVFNQTVTPGAVINVNVGAGGTGTPGNCPTLATVGSTTTTAGQGGTSSVVTASGSSVAIYAYGGYGARQKNGDTGGGNSGNNLINGVSGAGFSAGVPAWDNSGNCTYSCTSGGGGGAGGAGSSANAGSGALSAITGVRYGGGGPGSVNGNQGTSSDGAGTYGSGCSAVANRGGGGTDCNPTGAGGNGGSGIVVIRYLVKPTITTQPVDATTKAGGGITKTFSIGGISAAGSLTSPSLTYQWEQSSDGGTTWVNVVGGSGATTTAYTTPLLETSALNGYKYRAKVTQTSGSITNFNYSNVATLTVSGSDASAPTALTTYATGTTDAYLTWTAPATVTNANPITGYYVVRSTTSDFSSGNTSTQVASTDTFYTMQNLTAGTLYYVKVYAYGSGWTGLVSDVASVTTRTTTVSITIGTGNSSVLGTHYTNTNGVIVAKPTTATSLYISASTLQTWLNAGNIVLSGTSISVSAPVSWSGNTSLTLGVSSLTQLSIYDSITATGDTAGLVLPPYAALYFWGGKNQSISMTGATPSVKIGGNAYTAISNASQIANIGTTGRYVLTRNINLTDSYTSSVRPGTFTGELEGFGNTISGMDITVGAAGNYGFFNTLGVGANVRDINFTNVNIRNNTANIQKRIGTVAGVVAATPSYATVYRIFTSGFITDSATTGSSEIGGIIGGATSGTFNGTALNNMVSIKTSAPQSAVGGILGANVSTFNSATGVGAAVNITQSWNSGDIRRTDSSTFYGAGGIMGVHLGTSASLNSNNSVGIVEGTGTNATTNVGGILGYSSTTNLATVSNSFTSSSSCGAGTVTTCLTGYLPGAQLTGLTAPNYYSATYGQYLNMGERPMKIIYVQVVAPTNGQYSGITTKLVNGFGDEITETALAALNLSKTGTAAFDTVTSASTGGSYQVKYSSGFTTGGTAAAIYKFVPWPTATSVTLAGAQTVSFTSTAPTTAKFGGTYLATATATSGLPAVLTIDSASSSVCSISGGTVSFIGVGTCTVKANQAGDANNAAAAEVTQSFTVAKATNTISTTSTAPTSAVVAGATYTPAATTTSGGSVSISIASGSSLVCSIANGVVSFQTAGSCVVQFDSGATTNYEAATQATQTFTVGKGSQTITFTTTAPTSPKVSTSYTIGATATGGGTVTFSTTSSACSVSGTTVSFTAVGSCVVKANQAGDSNWNAATENTQTITVTKGDQSITFTSTASSPKVGTTYTPTATVTGGGTVTFTIDSGSSSVCSISSGVVTFSAVGDCVILGDSASATNWSVAPQKPQTVTVIKGDQTISFTSVALAPKVGSNYIPTATATSGGTVTYTISTSSSAYCSITGGTISFLAVGDCVIEGNQSGTGNFNAAPQKTQTIAVVKGDQTISFTTTVSGAKVNGTATISATATGGGTVTFSTSSTGCSVSGTTISFSAVGSCVIKANQAGDTNWNAASENTQTISVTKGDQIIAFTSNAASPKVDTTYTPTATVTGGGLVTFTIASESSSICSIANGVVTFLSVGTCTVLGDSVSTTNWSVATQGRQDITVIKGEQSTSFTSTASAPKVGTTYTPEATATTGEATTFSIAAGSSTYCSIANGVVSFLAVGDCVIQADQSGNDNYNAAPRTTQTVSVLKGDQAIHFTSVVPSAARIGGDTYIPTATGGSSTSDVVFSIASSSSSVCHIELGEVLYDATGDCTVNADQAGDANYNAATQFSQTYTVSKGANYLTWTFQAPMTAVVDGATYTPAASSAVSNAPVTYSIAYSSSSVCSISNGVVSFHAAGDCVILADQAASDLREAAAQISQTVVVGKGAQVITFNSTAPTGAIVSGANYTPHATGGASGHQVNFRIDLASNTVCSISAGVVRFIGVGNCVVNANQTGDANYESASQVQQTFAVAKGYQAILFNSTAPTNAVVSGASYTPTATGGLSGNAVSFAIASSSSSICNLVAGKVNFLNPGDCVVEANQNGNTNYNAATTATQTISVAKGAQVIVFNSTFAIAKVGGTTYAPVATGGASGNAVSFTIDNASSPICSVASGVVSFTAVGDCIIVADQAGDSQYNAAPSKTQTISVGKGVQVVSFTSTPPHNVQVQGASYTPTATGSASGINVVFSIPVNAQQYCTISNGVISFHAVGNCVLNADQAGDSNWNAAARVTQIFDITKGQQVVTITSTEPTDARVAGANYTLAAIGGSGTAPVTFSVSELATDICAVDGANVSFLSPGTCVVVANQAGDSQFNAANPVTQSFQVAKGVHTISFVGLPITPTVDGATYTPSVTAGGSTASIVLTTNDSTVCEVVGNSVRFHQATSCTVYANQHGDAKYEAATEISQTFTVAVGTQSALVGHASLGTLTLGENNTPQAVLTVTGGSGTGAYGWSVDPASSSVCSINDDVISGLAVGFCNINLTRDGDSNYLSAAGAMQISVSSGNQTPVQISVDQQNVTYAPNLALTLSLGGGAGEGATWFESTTPHVCNTSGNSELQILHAGTCTVIGHKDGDGTYQAAQDSITFTVAKAAQTGISLNVATAMRYSPSTTISSTLVVGGVIAEGAQTLSVVSGDCTIVDGALTATSAGACDVLLEVAEDENYLAYSVTKTFTIAKSEQSVLTAARANDAPAQISYIGVKTTTYVLSGGSGTGAISISSANESICTASLTRNNVTVTGVAAGACSIQVVQAADNNYLSASTTINLTIVSLPSAPTNVTLANTGTNTADGMEVTVSWTAPAAGNGEAAISGYEVQSKSGTNWVTVTNGIVGANATSFNIYIPAWSSMLLRVAPISAVDPADASLRHWTNYSAGGPDQAPIAFQVPGALRLISTNVAAVSSGEVVTLTGSGFEAGVTTSVEISSTSAVFTPSSVRAAAVAPTNHVTLPATVISPTQLTFVLPKITLPKGTTSLVTQVKVLATNGMATAPASFSYIPKKLTQLLGMNGALPTKGRVVNVGADLVTDATFTSVTVAPVVTATPANVCTAVLNQANKLVITPVSPGVCSISVQLPNTPGYLPSAAKTTSVQVKATRASGFSVSLKDVAADGTLGELKTFTQTNTFLIPGVVNVVLGEGPTDVPVTMSARQGAMTFAVLPADEAAGLCTADPGDATTGNLGSITVASAGDCHVTITQAVDAGWNGGESVKLLIHATERPTDIVVPDNGDGSVITDPNELAELVDPLDPDDPTTPPIAITLDPTRAADYSFGTEDGIMFDPATGKLNVRSRTSLVGIWTVKISSPNATKLWFKIPGKVVKKVQQYTMSNICKLTMTVKKDPKLKKKVTRLVGAGCLLSDTGKAALTGSPIQKIKVKYKRIRQYAKTGLSYVKQGAKKVRLLKITNRTWVLKIGHN